jgi:MoxR-like ATPase
MPIALHLVTGEPLLCGGPPGSAKSLLLCACYRALGLATITPNMAFAGVIEDLSGRRCGLRKA